MLPVSIEDIPQPFSGIVLFMVEVLDRTHLVAMDYYDRTPINIECADGVDLYFKMQYSAEGYGRPNVIPGGFVPSDSSLYSYLPGLRQQRDRRHLPIDAYGRFGSRLGKDIRSKAISLLKSQTGFEFEGGLKKVRYKRSLQDVASSKVCIDLPGNGPLCFRLVEYLAIGACVISYPHKAVLPVPLSDRENIVYCREDMSDLLELCEFYIRHEEAREAVAARARKYFDSNLERRRLAEYYLRSVAEKLDY